ncbi:XRE family transcripitonal regulator [Corynebacterium humireducens NBRC 106098 = DSM 45392]|uniref:XRE family transcripitonal regulator n=1 Tax=Corynebacterium humireducens NBRC 106098 = DSM 45392 TaxID=1223515 RepID=A0A0B5DD55_9CORY|nr:hypothetical protein [Corynebacterium humireducens]AJE33704.1 XRE family transcripitonal regulator [Corynebacterium humireducens NBRC 106098 = DSM 45392]
MTESFPTLPQVIGANVRRLRGNHPLADVASFGRLLGVRWSSGSIHAIERGDFKATIETIALLLVALDSLETEGKTLRGSLTIRDLLEGDDLPGGQSVQLTDELVTSRSRILALLEGGTSGTIIDGERMLKKAAEGVKDYVNQLENLHLASDTIDHLSAVEKSGPITATEQRLSANAGIHETEFRSWALHLWGKPFEQHRDEIAGKDSTPQKKGRVSRALLAEIKTAMKANRGND